MPLTYHETPLSVVFMGTPEMAARVLLSLFSLHESKTVDLKCVYTKLDKRHGKKAQMLKSPCHVIADKYNILVRTPGGFKNNIKELAFIKSLNPDLIAVVAYGLILPPELLTIPKYGTINLHPSLLPDLRGPSPIHYAILENLKFTGVSIMALDEGIDTGPLLAQQKLPIGKDEYFKDLYDRLSDSGADLLTQTIRTIERFRNNVYSYAYPQPLLEGNIYMNYTEQIGLNTQKIDFLLDVPNRIYSKIRAFSDSGGAVFTLNNKIIKILKAKLVVDGSPRFFKETFDETNGRYTYRDYIDGANSDILKDIKSNEEKLFFKDNKPGCIVSANKKGMLIKTVKAGVYINLLELKPEGKRSMGHVDFINGFRIKPGFIIR